MNSCPTMEHQAGAICAQADCPFKKPGFDARRFIELLLQQLTEEALESIDPGFGQILARPQCMSCAIRVLRGGKACLTESEWSHLNDMGRWHQRRQRRSRRWGCQAR